MCPVHRKRKRRVGPIGPVGPWDGDGAARRAARRHPQCLPHCWHCTYARAHTHTRRHTHTAAVEFKSPWFGRQGRGPAARLTWQNFSLVSGLVGPGPCLILCPHTSACNENTCPAEEPSAESQCRHRQHCHGVISTRGKGEGVGVNVHSPGLRELRGEVPRSQYGARGGADDLVALSVCFRFPTTVPCPTDASFLLRFLRVKKFSLPMAQQTLLKYLNMRQTFKHLIFDLDPSIPSVDALISSGCVACCCCCCCWRSSRGVRL